MGAVVECCKPTSEGTVEQPPSHTKTEQNPSEGRGGSSHPNPVCLDFVPPWSRPGGGCQPCISCLGCAGMAPAASCHFTVTRSVSDTQDEPCPIPAPSVPLSASPTRLLLCPSWAPCLICCRCPAYLKR